MGSVKSFQTEEPKEVMNIDKALSRKHSSGAKADQSFSVDNKTQTAAYAFITPKMFVMVVALTHGLCDIAGMPGFIYAKETLGVRPETMQVLAGIIGIPWSIKPIFGYLVDNMIGHFGRARPIFIFTCIFRFIGYFILGYFKVGMVAFYCIGFVNSVLYLLENIIAEFILVISTKKENEETGSNNSNQMPIYFGFRAFGSLIGGFFGGRIVKHYGTSPGFFAAATLPMLVFILAWIYRERHFEAREKRTFAQELDAMKQLLSGDRVLQLIIFVSLINMQPNFDSLYTYYYTDYLKFTTEDLANFSTFGTICYILGLILYSYYLKNIDPKKFYIATNFLLWLISVSFMLVVYKVTDRWGIDNRYFCLLNQGFYSFVAEINFMPLLAIWCAMCPANLEATSITLFTGLINLSSNLSNYFGAFCMWVFQLKSDQYEHMGLAVIIQNVYLLILITVIVFIRFPIPVANNMVVEPAPTERQIADDQKTQTVETLETNMKNVARQVADEKKIELVD